MSKVFTAKEIAERALRAIGAFPITQSSADGEQLREAMIWLDLNMAEIAGVTRLFSLVPATLEFDITNGTSSYDLNTELGADLPTDRIQFPVDAWLEDEDGNRYPLKIVTRDVFEAVPDAAEQGQPTMIHIDRLPTPTLRIYPTPATTDTTTWTIKLVVQTYAPNVAPGGVTGTQPSASVLTGFRQAWQRWLIWQLASDIGSGPVFKLPSASIKDFGEKAKDARMALEAFENREHETTEPVCEPWGME